MPDISSIPEAKMLNIEPVQNAAGNEWRHAKTALEKPEMMVDLWIDVFVQCLFGKTQCEPLGSSAHGGADGRRSFVAFGLALISKL